MNYTEEELIGEMWIPIENYEKYDISNLGRVRSNYTHMGWKAGDLRKITYLPKSYASVILKNPIGFKTFRIHTLVAHAFISLRPIGMWINHKDGNKHNNRVANLEYVTPKENCEHAANNGLMARGEHHGHNTGLTEQDIIDIRYFYNLGATKKELTKTYNLSRTHIYSIISRRTWSWV